MKNQYFGDVNDYRKYGLLRALAGDGGLRVAVCWMLTADDGRTDGSRRGYLARPALWQGFDPKLYRKLQHCTRNVVEARRRRLITGARYFERTLTDDREQRAGYFRAFLRKAAGSELVFFDPDNGLEVKSVPRGRRGSCKYLYRDELELTYRAGYSVLVYQHYPRARRDKYCRRLGHAVCRLLGVRSVLLFSTAHVLFLLAPQPRHAALLGERARAAVERWGPEIRF